MLIKIKNKIWFAENYNYNSNNCSVYDNNIQNRENYGCLYNWITVNEIIPEGWHIPSKKEWNDLIKDYGGIDNAGVKLQFAGISGLDIKMSGYKDELGNYSSIYNKSILWSSSEASGRSVWCLIFEKDKSKINN